ncbi:MAG TPA: phosphate ABC transporter permease subunit PstC [Fimbriimonas sp.]|nr:phosphate ABC transporter permease subunit PstC [Fimbriimonas sp.]
MFRGKVFGWAALTCAVGTLLATLAIALVLFGQSLPFFRHVQPSAFLLGRQWRPTGAPPEYGLLPLLAGSLEITLGAALLSFPLGVLSAIFLQEHAGSRVRSVLRLPLELLAGVPAVVYGYLGLFLVTPMLRSATPSFQASNAASAAIVVAIMILPLIASVAQDAIAAVPEGLREGGYALGFTKTEVILRLVLPAARSGIFAALVLALSRAIGETIAVTLAAGSTAHLTLNPTKSMATMTSYILTTTQGDAEAGSMRYLSIFAVGLVLFVITFTTNVIASRLRNSFKARLA